MVLGPLMTLVGRHLIMQRRVFWFERYILSPCWMKVVLILLPKGEDSHWSKYQKYLWHQNLCGYPYSLHQHRSERLLNDLSQLLFPFWFPEHKSTNTTATPDAISLDPVFCLFEFLGPIPTREVGVEYRRKRLEIWWGYDGEGNSKEDTSMITENAGKCGLDPIFCLFEC